MLPHHLNCNQFSTTNSLSENVFCCGHRFRGKVDGATRIIRRYIYILGGWVENVPVEKTRQLKCNNGVYLVYYSVMATMDMNC